MAVESYFDGQRDDERVLGVWRRNFATLLGPGLMTVTATLVLVSIYKFFGASLLSSLALGLWLITVPLHVGITWYRWWNDLYILTTQRLIDVDQPGIFHRLVTELPLENVQDATFELRGVVQTLLNYGTITVMSASGSTQIDIAGVTDPQMVQQSVLRAVAKLDATDRPRVTKPLKNVRPQTQLG